MIDHIRIILVDYCPPEDDSDDITHRGIQSELDSTSDHKGLILQRLRSMKDSEN
uniref:Uncharacterized protein n=1 Tax=viral metagenome TaxID=1070528 RepID=A0A6C0BMI0_9ZZZZ